MLMNWLSHDTLIKNKNGGLHLRVPPFSVIENIMHLNASLLSFLQNQ